MGGRVDHITPFTPSSASEWIPELSGITASASALRDKSLIRHRLVLQPSLPRLPQHPLRRVRVQIQQRERRAQRVGGRLCARRQNVEHDLAPVAYIIEDAVKVVSTTV